MARKIKVLRFYLRTFSWQYLIQKSNSLYALDRQTKGQEKSHHDRSNMSRALIIGAGGVAGVVIHKCCQNSEVFTDICIASRTKSKCDKFKEELQDKTKTNITTAQVNADNVPELVALMKEYKPDICINVALPYQDRSSHYGRLS